MNLTQGKRFLSCIFMGLQQLGLIDDSLLVGEGYGLVSGGLHGVQYNMGELKVKGGGNGLRTHSRFTLRWRSEGGCSGNLPVASILSFIGYTDWIED